MSMLMLYSRNFQHVQDASYPVYHSASKAAKKNRIFSVGESALITGTNRNARIEIEIFPTQNVSPNPINPLPDKELKQPDFQAIDLMLEGNLEAQIKYSFIEAIAATIDEKARILTDAELEFTGNNKISFAEAAMPEIEAMASSIVDSCVDFSKISLIVRAHLGDI